MDFNLDSAWDAIKIFFATYALKATGALLTLIIGFWLIGRFVNGIRYVMENRDIDPSLRPFLATMVSVVLRVLLLLSVISMFGVDVTSFIAVFSAAALAIGLALQGNLANFASGILILIFKFYRVGDFIEAGGHSGIVREIQIFHTVLEGLDRRLIIIPNGEITGGAIQNYTIQGKRRHDLSIGIGYDDNIDKAREVIRQVLEQTPGVLHEEGYDIFVNELGDDAVKLAVRFQAKNEDFWPAYKYFLETLKKSFDRESIGIPFKQIDVHLVGNRKESAGVVRNGH